MDSDLTELINREIDGVNSQAESARLQEIVAADEQARTEFQQLSRLADLVSHLDLAEPPAGLRANVMASLPTPQKAPAAGIAEWWMALKSVLAKRPAVGYAWTLVAGIFIGAAAIGLIRGNPDQELVSGTIGSVTANVDHLAIAAPGARGFVRMSANPEVVSLDISVDADNPVDLQLLFSEAELVLLEIQRSGSGAGTIGADAGQILLAIDGNATYRLSFNRASETITPLSVQLLRGGELEFLDVIPARE